MSGSPPTPEVVPPSREYHSADEDSTRWLDFAFRPGDIVISTRSKNGTTWMQTICLLLVLGTPELSESLTTMSPWLDWLVVPAPEVFARLDRQQRRRVIKTHTPLDGVPIHPEVRYIVVGRHPLDMAVSLYHHLENLDRDRLRELSGGVVDTSPRALPPMLDWVRAWVDADPEPTEDLDSLVGVMWHLRDAWERRALPNVRLVHYDDLCADLEGQMRSLADWLGIEVAAGRWPALVEAAGLPAMRSRAADMFGDVGVFKDPVAFFRRGSSGAGREVLSAADLARYDARVTALAPPDLLEWLHH